MRYPVEDENGVIVWSDTGEALNQSELLALENQAKIDEAKAYLASTDYKMTSDYDKDTTDVKAKRAEARALIRTLGA